MCSRRRRYIEIKPRRPLWPKKSRYNKKNFVFVITLFLFFLTIPFLYYSIFNIKKILTFSNDNHLADNQSNNWKNATSIYQFKIETLDKKYLYLSSLKNQVILIIKYVILTLIMFIVKNVNQLYLQYFFRFLI
jgi:hypothetical protein